VSSVDLVSLGEHATFFSGFAFEASRFNTEGKGLPVVRIRDVMRGHSETFYDGPFDSRFVVESGDYLIGMDGEFNLARWGGGRALLNQRVAKIASVSPSVDRDFLFRFLVPELKRIEAVTPSVTVKHLSTKVLAQMTIPLPPLDEQRRIVRVLDSADVLRSRRIAAGRGLRELYRGALDRSLVVSAARQLKTSIGEVADFVTKGTTPTSVGLSYTEQGVPFIRVQDLDDGVVRVDSDTLFISRATDQELARSRIHAGDVLVSIAGTIGRVALVPDDGPDMNCNQAVAIVRGGAAVRPRFLRAALESHSVQSQIRKSTVTGTISNLSLAQVRALSVRVPPLADQIRFERIDEAHRAALRRNAAHLTMLNALFSSLEHRAFAGEL